MKEYVLELTRAKADFNAKLNTMREYLQAYILRIMHDEGVFRTTAFVGGTALRFLHNIPRFSEDLDFSLVKKRGYEFLEILNKIKRELKSAGYNVDLTYKTEKAVQNAFVKFFGLMYEAEISPHKGQTLSVKIELDTNPPKGAVLKNEIVNKYFPIAFLSYELSSLFAGKLHALLMRKYTKGRDFFDLGWYLSRWKGISPNITFLQNALKQTGWNKKMPTKENWIDYLYEVVKGADWKKVNQDVKNFLENSSDANIFSKENVLGLIQSQSANPA